MTTSSQSYMPPCAICGKPCLLEECKVSDDGKRVHEGCIFTLLLEEKDTTKS
jgi:hypothetical protein